nr:MAG TPA: hypothetical protein [Caudoviricetes sp.]
MERYSNKMRSELPKYDGFQKLKSYLHFHTA